MSFQERPGDSPHPGVCPQPPSWPSPQGAMTKVLTSCLSHHPASDSVQWPGEHTLSMDHRWQSPRPGRPGRGGPPASLDFSCSLPWPSLLLLPDPGASPQKLFPLALPSHHPSRSARVSGPCSEPQSGLCRLPPGGEG